MSRHLKTAMLCAGLLAGCATERIQGVNLLQSREISFEHPQTAASLKELRRLGATTVAVVVFLEQSGIDASTMRKSDAVTDAQLANAIWAARRQGLKVYVKPQMLVENGWAGAIEPTSDAHWRTWFDVYLQHLLEYARLAESEGADGFVIGTELRRAATRSEWAEVIAALRREFSGTLTYAAHDIAGLDAFGHWHLLDTAGVTLYPPLGSDPSRAAMRKHVDASVADLKRAAQDIGKPIWISEVGIQSRLGAQEHPWEWRNPNPDAPAAPELQAEVIDLWLEALSGDWNKGVLLWAWSNDPQAGGVEDKDFLLQNKPVEEVLRCRWSHVC